MAALILDAQETEHEFLFLVHLDPLRIDDDGRPDPQWVRLWKWGKEPTGGQSKEQYWESIMAMLAENVRNELAVLLPPPPGARLADLIGQPVGE
jgi:hypothetical protein